MKIQDRDYDREKGTVFKAIFKFRKSLKDFTAFLTRRNPES